MKIESIQNLLNEGRLDEALKEINGLNKEEALQGEILQCKILNLKGNSIQGLRLIEKIIDKVKSSKDILLEIKASIVQSELQRALGIDEEALITLNSSIQLLQISKGLDQEEKSALFCEIFNIQGSIHQSAGNVDQAINCFTELLSHLVTTDGQTRLADCYNNLGVLYIRKGNFTAASDYQNQALTHYQHLDHQQGIASSLNNLGIIYSQLGDYSTALEMYERSLEIFTTLNQTHNIGNVYNSLGNIYKSQSDLDTALNYFNKAKEIFEELNDQTGNAIAFINIGIIHKLKWELDDAIRFTKKALEYFVISEDQDYTAMSYNNLGVIHELKGDLTEALECYYNTLAIYEFLGNRMGIARSMENIGNALKLQGELDKAVKFLKNSLEIRSEIGNDQETAISLYSLILTMLSMQSEHEALNYHKRLEDINSKSNNKQVALYTQIGRALILKENKRIVKKAKAMELFQKIVSQDEVVDYELQIFAIMKLCELLLIELKALEEQEVLTEIQKLLEKVYDLAETHNSTKLMIETIILQSNFALIKGDGSEAYNLLDNANKKIKANGLQNLGIKIEEEKQNIKARMDRMVKFVDENERLQALLEEKSLFDYINQVSKIRDRGIRE
ncbi:MAG: tetratricopeptide repeat protein [Candidatus Kariarchaeaceae archaeon]|jgi:tetratricopeptide (TPR) repeat protein